MKRFIGPLEEKILRTIFLTIGLACVGAYITPAYAWWEFWMIPEIKFYNLMTFLTVGFFSHLQMKLKGVQTFAVFTVFGAVGFLLAERIKDYVLIYNLPNESLLIVGLIIFILSFKR